MNRKLRQPLGLTSFAYGPKFGDVDDTGRA